jgi:hypothetical protein
MSETLERPRAKWKPDVVVTAVPHEFLAEEFIRTGPLMERAAKATNGRYQVEDLFESCIDQRHVLWIAAEILPNNGREYLAVLFTRVVEYPRKRALRIEFAAGVRLAEWLGQFAQASRKAAALEGCDLLEGGRMGWKRVLSYAGVKPTGLLFEAELTHEPG